MKSKNRNKELLVASCASLVFVVAVIVAFVFFNKLSSSVFAAAPWISVAVIILLCHVYTVITARKLYGYFEASAPVITYIPCVGELSLLNRPMYIAGLVCYALIAVFGVLIFIPYHAFGTSFLDVPFYCMCVVLVLLVALQVIKGVGLLINFRDILAEYKAHRTEGYGLRAHMIWFGFFPFVRAFAIRTINQPLTTLSDFMGVSYDSDDEDEFEEE